MARSRLFLLDAYALIFRSYYAFMRNPRITSKGVDTSALFGFTLSLLDILEKESPDLLAVVFDPAGGSFRHKEYEEYKAQRDETPEGIKWAVPEIKKLLATMQIPVVEVPNYEADDVIGALSKKAEKKGYEVFMVTPDKDYAQLVTEHCKMFRPSSKGYEIWGEKEVCAKFDLNTPRQVIDYLGLVGDTADNIPGCKGIGPKTASTLLLQYGSLDEVYNHLDELKPSARKKLEEYKEQTLFSRYLATICTDIDFDFEIEDLKRKEIPFTAVSVAFEQYEFRSLQKRLQVVSSGEQIVEQPLFEEGSLFAPVQSVEEKNTKKQDNILVDSLIDIPLQEEENTNPRKKTLADVPHNYHLVANKEERETLWSTLRTASSFAFDTETDGLDSLSCSIVGASFSTAKGEAYFILLPEDKEEAIEWLSPLSALMSDAKIVKIAQNAKFDLEVLSRYGVASAENLFDTLIAHYLVAPERSHKLDDLAEQYLSYTPLAYSDLAEGKSFDLRKDVPLERLVDYASEDADIAFQLYAPLKKELEEAGMTQLFEEIEMPLVQVLQRMEERGIKLDTDKLKEVGAGLNEQIAGLERAIFEIAGHEFNVASPKQVGQVLFEELQISKKPRKTKSGGYATSEEVLASYADTNPIVQHILDFRGLRKLMSTYIDALPQLLYPDGKLHSSFNQAVAATGRLSSSNPNLQNIPIKTTVGQEMRSAFVPESDEFCFLSADYSQVELRLLAHLSGDEHLIEAFTSGEDVHRKTAARIYKIAPEEVTARQRSFAKTANFGIIYGISSFGLSQRLHIPPKEAQDLIDSYFKSYPTIQGYIEKSKEEARTKGYAETLLGRRRYLPDINSQSATVRNFAERNAMNAPIQGTAADLIKIAMVRIDKILKERGMKSRLILQVHDELNFDAHKEELEELKSIVRQEMMSAMGTLKVPLEVEMGVGANWLEAH